jgi:NAD(P)-dependent dehydrogenase (short-subunit alcohol dehydrogenase family)
VLVADLNAEAAQAVATKIRDAGGTAESTNVDLSDEASVIAAIDLAVSTYGGLDVMHANAADTSVTGQDTDIADVPLEIFDRTIEVNLRGHLLCALTPSPSSSNAAAARSSSPARSPRTSASPNARRTPSVKADSAAWCVTRPGAGASKASAPTPSPQGSS